MSPAYAARLAAVGRIGLASLFLLAGLNKLLNYQSTLEMMHGAGLEPAALLLPATILLELGAGGIVAWGKRYAAIAALLLSAFTLATNLIFHRFWEFEADLAGLQLSLFFKNIAIMAALLYVATTMATRANDA